METGEIIAMSENDDWLKKWIWGRTGSAYLFDHHRGVLKDLAQAEVDATRIKFSQLRRRVVETEKVDAELEAREPLIRKDEAERSADRCAEYIKTAREEAKRKEREGILDLLEKEYPAITTWQCWRALKGEGKAKNSPEQK